MGEERQACPAQAEREKLRSQSNVPKESQQCFCSSRGSGVSYTDCVAEPHELFRLKCASHRYTSDINSTHLKRNNSLACRVSARYNHGSTGSKQVDLARRRVYNHATAHQLLIHNILNIITNCFKLKVNLYKYCLKRQAIQLVQIHSGRQLTRDYTCRGG
jgi:hypothetical protein